MKQRLLSSFLLFFICCSAISQQLIKVEYFFNTDPGHGNATAINFAAADSININSAIVIPSSLPAGLNKLYIRVANNNGVWSHPELYLVIVSNTITQINRAEYFFNTDPGVGNGNPITYPATDSLNLATLIILPPTLGTGLHNLYIRIQNTGGTWSMPEIYPVIVSSSTTLINAGEYFWDTDPGFGNGTVFNFSPDDSVSILQNITVPSLSPGVHKLFTRIKSTDGGWSMPEFFEVTVCTESITSQPNSQTVCAGTNATFTVTATGTGLTYQWRKNGTNISGATSATYTINNVVASDAGNYDVVVLGSCGSLSSSLAVLTVNAATQITTHPTGQSVCEGANVTFNAAATGAGTLTYQWKKNGTNISGATSNSYIINNVTTGDAGNYSVEVTGSCGTVVSSTASLTISTATLIITQPGNQSTCLGANITFNVSATGAGTLTYQWKKNGNIIVGATSSSYTINNIVAGDAANYSVDATGSCGTVASSAASLTINNSTAINTQPSNQTTCLGSSVTFTVSASGSGTLTYQWKKNGTDISGATSSSYTIVSVTAGDAANYSVSVTSSCGNVISGSASLSLIASTAITTQPLAQSVCSGANANFTVTAAGNNLSYQWRKVGVNISGATNAAYTITGVAPGDAGNYDVIVSGTCGNVTSVTVALSLSNIYINTHPASQTLCEGTNVTFSVSASGGGTLTYQWKKGGVNIGGAAASSYTINNISTGDAANYTVDVTNTCGTVSSNSATLTVNAVTSVTSHPDGQSVCSGSNVTFTVSANGTGLTYQWRKGGVNINGATVSSYIINNVSAADAGNYDAVVSGVCGVSTSNAAALSITPPPAITTQPASQTVFVGSNVTFTTTATGSGLTYQWRKGGVNIIGATASSFTINNISTSDAGNYDVVVSGTCSPAATSATAVLIVNTVSITSQPSGQSACVGSNASFSVTASGANLTYQWQVSTGGGVFTNISGANSTTLLLNAVTISQNGNQYRCVVSGSLNSNAATLTVNPLPVVSLNLSFDTLYQNSSLQTLSGGIPSGGVFTGTGISAGSFMPGAYQLGNYTVNYRYTDANGCSSSASDFFTIIPKADKVNLYPVPAKDGNINFVVSPDLIGSRVIIFNERGQKVSDWILNSRLTNYKFKWSAGNYTAVFKKGNIKISKQFIIIR